MPDFTVIRVGTDTSGRPIYSTRFYAQVRAAVLRRPRVQPFAHKVTTVQGAFMRLVPGGGAADSSGFHDDGGTEDLRVWNLTLEERAILWWEFALLAIIFWPRGPAAFMGGMDEHGHSCAGWDHPISSGIAAQWRDAMPPSRGSGLASGGPDYVKPRPPWVAFPPAELLQEDYMATDDAESLLKEIKAELGNLDRKFTSFRKNELGRDQAEAERDQAAAEKAKAVATRQIAALGGIADSLVEISNALAAGDVDRARALVDAAKTRTLDHLAADPDVDGADNPAGGGQ